MALHVNRSHLDAIVAHAEACAPDECCGILTGLIEGADVRVAAVHPVDNVWPGGRTDRFELDPRAHLRVQREARERGLDVVGFYHSHPDGPPVPSAFDAERAWPDTTYLIVSLHPTHDGQARSWRFDDDHARFDEEPVRVVDGQQGLSGNL